jgi:DNA mismatch repair protein MutS
VLRQLLEGREALLLAALRENMDPLDDVAGWIDAAIVDQPPVSISEGNVMKDGYDPELDRLRDLVRGGRDWIATLQREESARTKIPNLKVGYNKVFGYYLEVTRAYTHLVPEDFERKQTLVNAERYVTPRLKSREEEIVTAQETMQQIEYDLFVALRDRISGEARRIQETAGAIATIDVLLSLAETAATKGYAKPHIDDSAELRIRDGRHPVVEDLMARNDFVANDTVLDPENAALLIVTGPNMAGKSTYLRQVALITLMAQMGSFVPAAEAHIGVVDRIFTRVGASDNLVRGESTFMVEMIETANIINTATERSLLVLDEIGRGTSTFDGISIAWSVAEHIHDRIRAKTLFATHYHELTELANTLERAKNLNVAVREWGGKVVFLYRIVDGGADHSYGIQVAKLAGLPPAVLERAREILESLEAGNPASTGLPQQMYLFGAQTAEPSRVEKELDAINPDELSPKDAHELVYHLKHLLAKPRHER